MMQSRGIGTALRSLLIATVVTGESMAAPVTPGNLNEGAPMKWTTAELEKIVKADDLHIAPYREDGMTYGTPTWIWCVQVGGDLYVRAYNGTASRWYQAALKQKAGKIEATGTTYLVNFEPVTGSINESIDSAYQSKYNSSAYLKLMISERSRAATVRITPVNKGS
jgi:hypothetical protein